MGAGLSMASVNKIKELANSREYSLALELVEHQDLSKSLNPQFLRLCGEIYIKNNRYEDARRCLIMAHRLAPESKRIMYVFVELYLRMGYFELAKTYYDMYMFDAGSCDSRQMEYVWTKHEHPDALKDMEQLLASYMHNLDYDWSFELYLVYKKEEKKEEAHSLAELYAASFKNSENSDRICAIEKGKESADAYFDVYASVKQEDNDERYDALRSEEAELLAADDLRMHPKEAEITVMYEDTFTPAGSEKKVQKMLKKQDREEERKEKKLLKEQRKQEKKLEKEAAKAENPEEETTLEASAAEETKPETAVEAAKETKPETVAETVTEETKSETVAETVSEEMKPETVAETVTEETKPETAVETVSEETKPETAEEAVAEETKPETAVEATVEKEEIEEAEIEKGKKRGLFSKIFRKKKEVEDDTTEYAELVQTSESEIIDADQDDRPSENADAEKVAETETVHAESETDSNETIDTMTTGQADDMRHKSKTMAKNVVVVDDDNDFEAEADTIEELAAKEKSDVEKKIEDKKPAFEFQTVELAPDDFEDQFQVDDFSDKLDAEFGEMKSYEPEPKIEIEVEEPEAGSELEIEEPEVEIEEPEAETEEPEVEPELEVEEPEVEIEESEAETGEPEAEEPEVEIEEPETEAEEPETEAEEPEVEPELEIEEPEAEIEELEAGQPEVEIEEPEVEPEPESIIEESETEPELEIEEPEAEIEEPEVEPEPESIIEEAETEPELEIEEPEVEIEEPEVEPEPESIIEEAETEPELEIEEPEAEAEKLEVESEPEAEEPEFRVAPFTTKPEKKKLDFPVFKSSLFPDYHKEVKNVENNFDEIMEEAQDKMTENMRKEAQMQKEAEELLASLGISLNSIPAPVVKEEQPGQQGPSRDELKASLKIDTNKKNLLKRIKEYR